MRSRKEYFTVLELAQAGGALQEKIRFWCRWKIFEGAEKVGGKWRISITGIPPILKKEDYAVEKAGIEYLINEYPLSAIISGLNRLAEYDGLKQMQTRLEQDGANEQQALDSISVLKELDIEYIQGVQQIYSDSGLRGFVAIAAESQGSHKPGSQENISILEFLKMIDSLDDWSVEEICRQFEKNDSGRQAVAANPNRRIYAVLKPTREENLQRIKHVLCSVDTLMLH